MLRKFLIFSTLVWLPYGVLCFLFPEFISAINGVEPSAGTGLVEFKAIYGGLQSGMGLMLLLALFRGAMERPALLMLVFLCGAMAFGRFLAIDFSASMSWYNYFALILESVSALLAFWLLSEAE